jgi:hypothetical protein
MIPDASGKRDLNGKGEAMPAVRNESRHPIHRALAWSRRLANNPLLSKTTLTKQAGAAAGTVTHHLKLLQLAAPIQTFLLNLKTSSDLHIFSLNRMKTLAELPIEKQLAKFSRLQRRAGQPSFSPACASANEQAV